MTAERMLFVALMPACAIVAALGLLAWMKPGSAAARRVARLGGAGLLLLSFTAWVARWLAVGHMPLFGTYESSLSLALALSAVAMLTRRDGPVLAGSALLAGALLVHGFRFDPAGYALTISERSIFVDIHALFAWLAFGVLGMNAVLGALEIAGAARGTAGAGPWLARSLHWGFALHSAMMASGSFYKFLLFGTPWSFDPVETLGLLAWLAYGTLLHMHLFAGWEGRRLAGWCLFTFVLLVVSYRGIVYFPAWSTYHIFDMDLRIHLTGKELLN